MTIAHHPSDLTLAAFAAGTLDEGRALVVSTHVAGCPTCRSAVRSFERLRGVALEDGEPRRWPRTHCNEHYARFRPTLCRRPCMVLIVPKLGAPLSSYSIGPWRRLGGHVQWRSVEVPIEQGTRVFMLKAAPGTRIPHHEHTGVEWTCVLQGAFRHQLGRYEPGDFDEADDSVEHRVIVEDDVECVCLVALQGEVRLKGWFGRMI